MFVFSAHPLRNDCLRTASETLAKESNTELKAQRNHLWELGIDPAQLQSLKIRARQSDSPPDIAGRMSGRLNVASIPRQLSGLSPVMSAAWIKEELNPSPPHCQGESDCCWAVSGRLDRAESSTSTGYFNSYVSIAC